MMNCVVETIWKLIYFGVLLLVHNVVDVYGIAHGKLFAPSTYTALSGDFQVELQTSEILEHSHLHLKIAYEAEKYAKTVDIINILPSTISNTTRINVPCELFTREGIYSLKVVGNEINSSLDLSNDNMLEHKLDVRWPEPKLSVTPESIGTYPDHSVTAVIEFVDVECPVNSTTFEQVPKFWLELIFCGSQIYCDSTTVAPKHVLYSEQIVGITRSIVVPMRCEYFGLAGNYIMHLKPVAPLPSRLSASAFIKADWNSQYIFNVNARSISNCDHSGIGVLFQYPACILDNDKIRLYGKLRADVVSLAPPTSLVYIAEKRVERGKHTVSFDCEYFSEKYIEYCFVYVTQAITHAVADIRTDCVPTLNVTEFDSGKWGRWSEWSPCTSKFSWGTQIRYRFCDSPPPRYGGKFCEGPSTETKTCGGPFFSTWEYFFGSESKGSSFRNGTDIMEEVGPHCRCGCIIHLLKSKPRRLLASSSKSCPGRALWLIEVEEGQQIQFNLDYYILPCENQIIKIRDGSDAMLSELIGEFVDRSTEYGEKVISRGNELLIDFVLNDTQLSDQSCQAGFIGHAELIEPPNMTIPARSIMSLTKDSIVIKLNLIHFFVFVFSGIIILLSVFLGAQYIFRYHKYQLAKSKEEPESPLHTPPSGSTTSLPGRSRDGPLKAVSTSTIFSEVITLVKLKPKSSTIRHKKLRESVVSQDLEKEHLNDYDSIGPCSNTGSVDTLTNDVNNEDEKTPIFRKKKSHSAPESDASSGIYEKTPVPKKKLSLDDKELRKEVSIETVKDFLKEKFQRQHEKDTDEASTSSSMSRSKISPSATLTSGNYSPALSLTSTARIRINNLKENKEKRNREKLMAYPGSQYSISTQEDLELDYYDYNVINASAAPGSYLGMDPAFLVWIPPLDEGNIMNEIELDTHQLYDEILPMHTIDPGSNKESPEDDLPRIPAKPPRKNLKSPASEEPKPLSMASRHSLEDKSPSTSKEKIISKLNLIQKTCNSTKSSQQKPHPKHLFSSSRDSVNNLEIKSSIVKPDTKRISVIEKETSVIKSPSDNKICEYYELSDIKFADEEDLDDSNNKIYKDTNLQVNN